MVAFLSESTRFLSSWLYDTAKTYKVSFDESVLAIDSSFWILMSLGRLKEIQE